MPSSAAAAVKMTIAITKKALLRIAIRVLPDHRRHIHAQKIRSFVIINGIEHFVNPASFCMSRASSGPSETYSAFPSLRAGWPALSRHTGVRFS
jgi:hypothetical protein